MRLAIKNSITVGGVEWIAIDDDRLLLLAKGHNAIYRRASNVKQKLQRTRLRQQTRMPSTATKQLQNTPEREENKARLYGLIGRKERRAYITTTKPTATPT